MKTQMIVLSALALCACAGGPDRGPGGTSKDKVALTEKDPTYCKSTDDASRLLLETSTTEAKSRSGHSYEIREAVGAIEAKDRFYLAENGKTLDLTHKRDKGRGYETIATANLSLKKSQNLWFWGEATQSEHGPGEYYAYHIPSSASPNSHHPDCQRTGSRTIPCKSFHFEFYRHTDTGSHDHKPKIGDNVKPWKKGDDCGEFWNQTGSGDGEDGND